MKTNRFLALLLTICLLAGLYCVPVYAQTTDSGTCGDNATWTFDGATGTLTISGSGTAVGIPGDSDESYGKYRYEILHLVVEEGITEIAQSAFGHLNRLQSIRLANSVKTIGKYAFTQNSHLTELHLGTGLTSIGAYAFGSCFALTNVVLPDSLTHMDGEVFGDCEKLKSVAIPEGITVIDRGTFRACASMTHVYIPASVTAVNYGAFRGCDQLTDIYYGGTQGQWDAITIDDTVDGKGPCNGALFTATVHCQHSHSFDGGSVTLQATCSQAGVKTRRCTVCGAAKQEKISADHTWDGGKVTAATCTKDGEKVFTCTVCNTTKKESIAAVGHSWNTGTQNADTTVSYKCKNCTAIKIEGTPVVPTETTVPPTQSNETTAATVETENPNDSTADATVPSETEPDAGESAPSGGFPWGLVIGISLVALVGGGIGLWVWIKKKQQS